MKPIEVNGPGPKTRGSQRSPRPQGGTAHVAALIRDFLALPGRNEHKADT